MADGQTGKGTNTDFATLFKQDFDNEAARERLQPKAQVHSSFEDWRSR